MSVYFKCKICGQKHHSPITFANKKTFESTRLQNNKFQCPETGKSASYDKEDMIWKEE